MTRNMGNVDRIVRILIAVVFTALYFAGIISGTLGIILLVVAGIFLLTGLTGVCPLYLPFRLSTRRVEK